MEFYIPSEGVTTTMSCWLTFTYLQRDLVLFSFIAIVLLTFLTVHRPFDDWGDPCLDAKLLLRRSLPNMRFRKTIFKADLNVRSSIVLSSDFRIQRRAAHLIHPGWLWNTWCASFAFLWMRVGCWSEESHRLAALLTRVRLDENTRSHEDHALATVNQVFNHGHVCAVYNLKWLLYHFLLVLVVTASMGEWIACHTLKWDS